MFNVRALSQHFSLCCFSFQLGVFVGYLSSVIDMCHFGLMPFRKPIFKQYHAGELSDYELFSFRLAIEKTY